MVIDILGAVLFGFIVGWLICHLLWQKSTVPWLHALIALGGTVVAAAVLALFGDTVLFGWYAIGLILSLLASLATLIVPSGNQSRQGWQEMLIGPAPTTVIPARRDPPPAYQQGSQQPAEPTSPTAIPTGTGTPLTDQLDNTQPVRSPSPAASAVETAATENSSGTDSPPERKRSTRRPTSQRKRATDE